MAYDSARSQVVLFGGGQKPLFNDAWSWNGARWTELAEQSPPSARFSASMIYDTGTSSLVLFGGSRSYSGHPDYADTWLGTP